VVSRDIRRILTQRAYFFNIVLDDVSITQLTFSREYTSAVEAKQVAQQDSERAKFIVRHPAARAPAWPRARTTCARARTLQVTQPDSLSCGLLGRCAAQAVRSACGACACCTCASRAPHMSSDEGGVP
jgi:hypothetical protein